MLSSIYVENYKNLRKLQIDNLGRINLISGKNNTGKSSLLEAVYLYANEGNIESVISILVNRGEFMYSLKNISKDFIVQYKIGAFSSLFYGRKSSLDDAVEIKIGDFIQEKSIEFRLLKKSKRNFGTSYILEDVNENSFDETEFNLFFQSALTNSASLNRMTRRHLELTNTTTLYKGIFNIAATTKNQFIHTNNILRDENSKLFDAIALTNKEKSVIEALKIIEPRTERIAFVEGRGNDRSAVIKLADSDNIIPLSSMGDGINRILTIILALINSSGGYLLIDEFENGLHYSVQEQLWKIIFKLSVELDIQVFATTHSNDCISSFNEILSEQTDTSLGKYIRLDNVNGEIKEVVFSSKELNIAEQQDIELR